MSEKRKDNKGRLLKTGESQRKDGKYEFKYTNIYGERVSVYSWRLTPTDKMPFGKREDKSLREKEDEIAKVLDSGLKAEERKLPLKYYFEKYMPLRSHNTNTKLTTRSNYNSHFRNSELAQKSVGSIKPSDIKAFYKKKKEDGYANSTIVNMHNTLHYIFEALVEDDILNKNPAQNCAKEYNNYEPRKAMTAAQREEFFNEILKLCRVEVREKYYCIFTVMQGLSVRINELAGLTWDNVDLENRTVTITHGIVYITEKDNSRFEITQSCKNRNRIIPMTQKVYECFKLLEAKKPFMPKSWTVDGYTDFVFRSNSGSPIYPATVNHYLDTLVDRYNKKNGTQFPHITNHIFRHTGCTIMCESGMDINTVAYVMGHTSTKMVTKVYDTVYPERVRQQMDKVDEYLENNLRQPETEFTTISTTLDDRFIKTYGDLRETSLKVL